ncbi:hypothetical protein EG329_009639 [Mollisiaceae sp. DMI_Dod_QoI]|nr:hypothetical protein EG329_009639 [Helotiales sp. DMI_Dod_QoI]
MSNSSGPGALEYTITRQEDLALRFNPAIGSLELANALSYKYPMEPDIEHKIRRAILDHIKDENAEASNLLARSFSAGFTTMVFDSTRIPPTQQHLNRNWSVATGEPTKPKKKKKSKYSATKRKKVAEVRKRGACDYHRKRKTECKHPSDSREENSSSEPSPSQIENFQKKPQNRQFKPNASSSPNQSSESTLMESLSSDDFSHFSPNRDSAFGASTFDPIWNLGAQSISNWSIHPLDSDEFWFSTSQDTTSSAYLVNSAQLQS